MIGRVFLGQYRATRWLGEGAAGRVFLARPVDAKRQVVVKILHEHLARIPEQRDRFEREARLLAQIRHPHAVQVYEYSMADPAGPCLAMEYVRGVTLDSVLARCGRLSLPRVARIVEQLCDLLATMHAQRILHRDLKPHNLMIVDADSPRESIVVMDFGLATKFGRLGKPTLGSADLGTPAYNSPEAASGQSIDQRSDLYSVGVLAFELLTGRLPFQGSSTMDFVLAHATDRPPSFEEVGLGSSVPTAVEEVILSCLAKSPGDRPQSASQLAEQFSAALDGDASLRPVTGSKSWKIAWERVQSLFNRGKAS